LTVHLAALDRDDEASFWGLVAQLLELRQLPHAELALVTDLLGVMIRPRAASRRSRARTAGRRWDL
jgi:hypothetical protein